MYKNKSNSFSPTDFPGLNLSKKTLLFIIQALHLALVIWVLIFPFVSNTKRSFKLFYILIIILTIYQWILTNNICIVSALENKLSNKPINSDGITRKILHIIPATYGYENILQYATLIIFLFIGYFRLYSKK